ncbi:hypothetical protein [Ulvibacterium sp.]|uniref:hypothetical protein n=1 Tax=Ulvibacterium sp. TaxID=2665914 RepID=UPI00260200AF|nr:hypothetical protein [Ulvibacterium sp.]
MIKNYVLFFYLILNLVWVDALCQEIRVFTKEDFDLNGDVKSCLVITDYGKEEYDFDENGLLMKSVTRYNDSDYDITYYQYDMGFLKEKRLENYRGNTFDTSTSIAHFYELDTTGTKKITEKIVSYAKEFLDQYQYFYDVDDRLVKVIRTNNDGTDETSIEYTAYKDEQTKTYRLNGVEQKSIRTSDRKNKNGNSEKVVLTKKYLNGDPLTATEEIFDTSNRLLSTIHFGYDEKTQQFAPDRTTLYTYDDNGTLSKLVEKRGNSENFKEYIYQYDDRESGNWVKQIITPDNAYTTRRIKYYEFQEEVEEE